MCNILIQVSATVTIPYLCRLDNKSIQLALFPESLLLAFANPVYKEGSRMEESKKNPISLPKCLQ